MREETREVVCEAVCQAAVAVLLRAARRVHAETAGGTHAADSTCVRTREPSPVLECCHRVGERIVALRWRGMRSPVRVAADRQRLVMLSLLAPVLHQRVQLNQRVVLDVRRT